MNGSRQTPRAAFTLIELLVVIGILALLMALAIPALRRTLQSGKSTACLSNLRQIGVGLNGYLAEHDMTMPALQGGRKAIAEEVPVLDNTLDRYITDRRIFKCPGDDRKLAETTGTSYFWNSALNGQKLSALAFLRLTDEHSRIPLMSDKEGFHPYTDEKVNILYADGHATKELKFWEETKP